MVSFKILESKSTKDFTNTIAPELYAKYVTVLVDIVDKKIQNLFIDIFGQHTQKIDVSSIRYSLIIHQSGSKYTFKFARVLTNGDIVDIGPLLQLEFINQYHNEELFAEALLKIKSKDKNISKNDLKDTVGKVHTEKQDLKSIKLKKSIKNRTI